MHLWKVSGWVGVVMSVHEFLGWPCSLVNGEQTSNQLRGSSTQPGGLPSSIGKRGAIGIG